MPCIQRQTARWPFVTDGPRAWDGSMGTLAGPRPAQPRVSRLPAASRVGCMWATCPAAAQRGREHGVILPCVQGACLVGDVSLFGTVAIDVWEQHWRPLCGGHLVRGAWCSGPEWAEGSQVAPPVAPPAVGPCTPWRAGPAGALDLSGMQVDGKLFVSPLSLCQKILREPVLGGQLTVRQLLRYICLTNP